MLEGALAGIGRVIGKPAGWERIVRTLAPPQRFTGSPLQPTQAPCGYTFPVDRGTLIGWSVHFFGSYEPEVQAQITRWLGPGEVAIDVGANVGWHTLLMAARVGPGGHVYAFEPNATTRERLGRAVEENRLPQVRIDSRAVTDRAGTMGFEAPDAGHVWDGTGHLQPSASPSVVCTTIDAFVAEQGLRDVALMKIDVEGWELSVLRGAARTLETFAPAVLFEYDPAYLVRTGATEGELQGCFSRAGYQLFALAGRRGPTAVSRLGAQAGNFLAVPSRKASRHA